MPRSRRTQISVEDTPFYHAVSSKAWLTGVDSETGRSYEHRREQVESQLLKLGEVFAIDIAAYAVMSNHSFLILLILNRLAMTQLSKLNRVMPMLSAAKSIISNVLVGISP